MKFSEMKYERPDLDKVRAQCEEYAKKMAAAQSGEELVQLYREENAMMAHYHTASCLASIHYTQDTRDEYWSGEQEWFDATGPAVSNAARNVAEAILSNPHAKALEEAFGTRILPSLRNPGAEHGRPGDRTAERGKCPDQCLPEIGTAVQWRSWTANS